MGKPIDIGIGKDSLRETGIERVNPRTQKMKLKVEVRFRRYFRRK
jgi:hypothetical protein